MAPEAELSRTIRALMKRRIAWAADGIYRGLAGQVLACETVSARGVEAIVLTVGPQLSDRDALLQLARGSEPAVALQASRVVSQAPGTPRLRITADSRDTA